jgi:hypothetical protein
MRLAVNRLTNTLYATSGTTPGGQSVYAIDGAHCRTNDVSGCGAPPATILLGRARFSDLTPIGIAVAEATNTVFTANLSDGEEPGSVSIIDGAACNGRTTRGCGQTPPTVPAGFGTVAVAVDPLTATAYTANDQDTSVTAVACRATKPCPATETRPIVGDYPHAITIDALRRTAYVVAIEGVSVIGL